MKSLSLALLVASALAAGCASAPKTPAERFSSAARYGRGSVIRQMLAEGHVPGQGSAPDALLADGLGWVEHNGDWDLGELIVARCKEAYERGKNCQTVPCYAARKGTPADVKAFLDRGLSLKDEVSGATLLGCAAYDGNVTNVKFLIERGADVEDALQKYEESNSKLAGMDPKYTQQLIAKNNAAIKLLERLRPGGEKANAPIAAGGGVSAADLERIVKSAVAASKPAAQATPAAPAEIKSDVDSPAYKVTANPDAFAVVVGVEKYNALPDAKFAERDAKAMNAHLLAMGYPQRNIVLLTGPSATRTGLVKNLEAWLPNQVSERSTVMFYFSGHGAPDAKTSEAYLVPMDGDPQYLEETAYPIKRLYEKLSALKAKRVLVALDSCFSGAGGRSVLASGTRPLVAKLKLVPGEGKIVSLAASSSEEITGALEEQGHGLFTYHLLKALGETAGRGSVSEIYAALTPRVQDEARRQNRAQTPQVFGSALDAGLR